MKIAIMGHSGAGKSTLAKRLSLYFDIPLLYLDTANFKENWQVRDRDECRQIVADFMMQDSWVIDGNYSEFYQDERLQAADLIIILNYSRIVCIKGAFGRCFAYKGRARESMAQGCNERIDFEFFCWIIFRQYSVKRALRFRAIKKRYPDKTHIIKWRRQLNEFLESVCFDE